jgi:hypothetical protein
MIADEEDYFYNMMGFKNAVKKQFLCWVGYN